MGQKRVHELTRFESEPGAEEPRFEISPRKSADHPVCEAKLRLLEWCGKGEGDKLTPALPSTTTPHSVFKCGVPTKELPEVGGEGELSSDIGWFQTYCCRARVRPTAFLTSAGGGVQTHRRALLEDGSGGCGADGR